jgi:hypothetical protein
MDLPKMKIPKQPPKDVYVRFGLWSRRSYNSATHEYEKGVSVCPAVLLDGAVSMLDYDDEELANQLRGSGRLAYVVTGKCVGAGSDGEPLLTCITALAYAMDVRVGRYLAEKQLVQPVDTPQPKKQP